MNIYDFNNYRYYTKSKLSTFPKKGYGQAKKLATYINVSTAFISQVLSEVRHFTTDQAFASCEFLGLSKMETTFYLKLFELEKSGNKSFKKWIQKELDELKESSREVMNRLEFKQILRDEDKAIFYSDWYYSAIRMHCSIRKQNIDQLVSTLGLARNIINEAVQFLLQSGLIKESNGGLIIGPQSTHIGSDSPWVSLHHSNWRKKAIESVKIPSEIKVHYTSPMTLSKKDAEKIQSLLLKSIEDIGKIVDPSLEEDLYCLNVDWFCLESKS